MIFIITILILEIVLDFTNKKTYNCINKKPKIAKVLLLHHILNVFLMYGWLFDDKKINVIHILVVIGIIFYWKFNENKCNMTVEVNRECLWNEDEPFNDLLNMIGLKKLPMWNEIIHYLIIIIGGLISLYKFMN